MSKTLNCLIVFSQLYRVYKGEIILIEINAVQRTALQALYMSKTGRMAISSTPVKEMTMERGVNCLPKISLLTANYFKMQQRSAAFGLVNHWHKISIDKLGEAIKMIYGNEDIDLEPPPLLKPFTMNDLQGAFYLLIILLGITSLFFLCEILTYNSHLVHRWSPHHLLEFCTITHVENCFHHKPFWKTPQGKQISLRGKKLELRERKLSFFGLRPNI